jgi:hypothetical protein
MQKKLMTHTVSGILSLIFMIISSGVFILFIATTHFSLPVVTTFVTVVFVMGPAIVALVFSWRAIRVEQDPALLVKIVLFLSLTFLICALPIALYRDAQLPPLRFEFNHQFG